MQSTFPAQSSEMLPYCQQHYEQAIDNRINSATEKIYKVIDKAILKLGNNAITEYDQILTIVQENSEDWSWYWMRKISDKIISTPSYPETTEISNSKLLQIVKKTQDKIGKIYSITQQHLQQLQCLNHTAQSSPQISCLTCNSENLQQRRPNAST